MPGKVWGEITYPFLNFNGCNGFNFTDTDYTEFRRKFCQNHLARLTILCDMPALLFRINYYFIVFISMLLPSLLYALSHMFEFSQIFFFHNHAPSEMTSSNQWNIVYQLPIMFMSVRFSWHPSVMNLKKKNPQRKDYCTELTFYSVIITCLHMTWWHQEFVSLNNSINSSPTLTIFLYSITSNPRILSPQKVGHAPPAVLALCVGNPPVTGGFPSQRARHWWQHMCKLIILL